MPISELSLPRDNGLRAIADKVYNSERLSEEEGVLLFEKGELGFVGALAAHVANRLHGDKVYFNRNFHIEPTNVCVFTCNFCSYSRQYKHRDEGWDFGIQLVEKVAFPAGALGIAKLRQQVQKQKSYTGANRFHVCLMRNKQSNEKPS